jgi:hypothetical protein
MPNYGELQAVLNKEFQEPMADLIARSNPMLAGLPKKSLATDRIWLRHKVSSDHEAGPVLDGADVTMTDPKSVRSAGVLDWSTYVSKFSLPKRLLAQVQSNPAMIGQLFQDEVVDAAKDLADRIAADLGKGDTANGLVGLQSVFSATNTYAGINRAAAADANAYWRGLVVDAVGGDLSTSLFYDAEEAWFNRNFTDLFNGDVPVIFTTKRLQRKYKELFEQISYDALSASHFVNQANASGNLGKSGIAFQGAPILPDRNIVSTGDTAATDRLYVVKPNSLFLATLTPNIDPEVQALQQISASYGQTTENLNVEIEILGNRGERVEGYIKTYVQLVCMKPSEAGVVIRNVSNVL